MEYGYGPGVSVVRDRLLEGTVLVEQDDLVSVVAPPGKDPMQGLGEAERATLLEDWKEILVRPGDGRVLFRLEKEAADDAEDRRDRLIKTLQSAGPGIVVEAGLATEERKEPVLATGSVLPEDAQRTRRGARGGPQQQDPQVRVRHGDRPGVGRRVQPAHARRLERGSLRPE